MIKKNLE